MFQKVSYKPILNQTFNNSGDYVGAVYWAVVCRVTVFALFVNRYNHSVFPLGREGAAMNEQVGAVRQRK